MFPGPLGVSLAGKALASGLWALEARDIRASATDRHRSVDDTPAGGGPGMVLRADVLAAAIDAADAAPDRPRLLMSPRGRPLTQSRVMELAGGPRPPDRLRPVRGRRPARHRGAGARGGLDRRLCAFGRRNRGFCADRRLCPAAAGRDGQAGLRRATRAFREDLLEYPQYTRPQDFEGRPIPEILISGDHAKVAAWRQAEAEALTRTRRPDLWAARAVSQAADRPKTPKKHDGRVTSRAFAV